MRHRVKGRKLNRTAAHRKALMRNLMDSLIIYGRIETTLAKAKELKRFADNFLSKVRKNNLNAKRKAKSILRTKDAFKKLFTDDFIDFLNSRNGGYVRVIRTRVRKGDSAQLAIIELTGKYEPKDSKKKEETVEKVETLKKEETPKVEEKTEEVKGEKIEEKVTEEVKEEKPVEEKVEEKQEKIEEPKEEIVETKPEEIKEEKPEDKKEDTKEIKEEKTTEEKAEDIKEEVIQTKEEITETQTETKEESSTKEDKKEE